MKSEQFYSIKYKYTSYSKHLHIDAQLSKFKLQFYCITEVVFEEAASKFVVTISWAYISFLLLLFMITLVAGEPKNFLLMFLNIIFGFDWLNLYFNKKIAVFRLDYNIYMLQIIF